MAYYKEGPDYSLYTMGPSWVVPVDAVQFVAHLQAHLENLPTRRTLSLCHRFGRGHHVHITKLPKELLDMIAEESDQISRSAFLDIQSEAYRCFAETCEQGDHLGCSCTLPRVEEQPCLEHRRALEIVASETHKTLAKEWCADVRSITERGPFQMVLRYHFGMVAQILHQFAPAPLAEVLEGRPRRLAVAFLRLYREEEDNFAIPRSENLTLLPFEAPYDSFCITEKEKKRFYRILRALRLDVSVHPVLSIMPISSPRARRNCELLHGLGAAERRAVIETLVKEWEGSEWPRMFNLTQDHYTIKPLAELDFGF